MNGGVRTTSDTAGEVLLGAVSPDVVRKLMEEARVSIISRVTGSPDRGLVIQPSPCPATERDDQQHNDDERDE